MYHCRFAGYLVLRFFKLMRLLLYKKKKISNSSNLSFFKSCWRTRSIILRRMRSSNAAREGQRNLQNNASIEKYHLHQEGKLIVPPLSTLSNFLFFLLQTLDNGSGAKHHHIWLYIRSSPVVYYRTKTKIYHSNGVLNIVLKYHNVIIWEMLFRERFFNFQSNMYCILPLHSQYVAYSNTIDDT